MDFYFWAFSSVIDLWERLEDCLDIPLFQTVSTYLSNSIDSNYSFCDKYKISTEFGIVSSASVSLLRMLLKPIGWASDNFLFSTLSNAALESSKLLFFFLRPPLECLGLIDRNEPGAVQILHQFTLFFNHGIKFRLVFLFSKALRIEIASILEIHDRDLKVHSHW